MIRIRESGSVSKPHESGTLPEATIRSKRKRKRDVSYTEIVLGGTQEYRQSSGGNLPIQHAVIHEIASFSFLVPLIRQYGARGERKKNKGEVVLNFSFERVAGLRD